ncbi:DUF4013 domain-containing protein [Haloferax mediterranei ATCC 33500]|uniref:DUF4013 domain-containing protein n=1 Tax=Haloferax mediterranei (strain ATCC 33500 / DSM 1411 / JCM 8866 / NBRC 14739 / NCIMB 2177 / R-4) TaxID=523841 RepID=I3R2A5_HALMT|nr:DUF4013 domain-containing protein [Haloferax mediterranei]AFK18365.1 hypothetical protein HFX_0641 [Haloferax mediterranei ATCC 33500]EMA02361.1 hypothetical protein C439_07260 [Haloferax mediterranei ATCC 33500]MDX5988456.1 DUF4013 domain-containing protein [Haloferax mediterranei ATCC 33500]QCQ74876.1 DUF4013 domain-containing protein [Haloferax mediterranei ATCC 33500]
MDVSDFESAFALPLTEETSFDTFVVGMLVTLASFATPLAGILLVGYVAKLVRAGDYDATALPSFDDFPGMAVEGMRLSAVLVALQLPAVGIATAVLSSSGPSLAALAYVFDPRMFQYLGLSAFGIVGLVVAAVAALVGTYLSAAATVALAREQSLAAAVPVTRTLVFDISFVPVVSAVALVVFSGRLLTFLFGAFPFGGVVLASVVSFLLLVASATLLGRGAPETPTESGGWRPEVQTDTAGWE